MRKLRAHHGLCMEHFIGEGYGDGFVRQMKHVIDSLAPDTNVIIVCGEDNICQACPHNQEGVCEDLDKVKEYDSRILELCGLQEGTIISHKKYKKLIEEKIIKPGYLHKVCSGCSWYPLCIKVEEEKAVLD